jgi:hypothetical protein
MGYLGCVGLKSRYHVPERKCESILVVAADLLEEIIDSNRELIVNKK